MKKILVLISFAFLFSCDDELKIPDVVLDQEKMVDVMTDVQIAESYIKLKFALKNDTITITDSVYAALYRKHGITEAVYDTSFQFYAKHPVILQEIYEKAINNLGTIEALNESSKKQSEPAKEEPPTNLVVTEEG